MGKTILYLFFAATLSAALAFLVMLLAPVLYVEATKLSQAVPVNVRVAASFSLTLFVVIIYAVSLAIPAGTVTPMKRFLFFLALPAVVARLLLIFGLSYFATLVVLAILAVPACYQVIVSHRKSVRH